LRHDRERVVGPFGDVDRSDAKAPLLLLEGVHRSTLEAQKALEKRPPRRYRAPLPDLDERTVFERPALDLLRLEALQPGHHCGIRRYLDPDRQGIDEQADHGFDAEEARRPSRDDVSEDHVRRAAVPAEKQAPRPLDDSIHGELMLPRQPLDGPARRRRDPDPLCAVELCGRAAIPTGPVDDQWRRLGESGERAAPETLGLGQVLLLQPGDVIAVRTRSLQIERLAEAKGLVEGEDLFEYKRPAPGIQQHVMVAPDHAVGVVRQADEADAHEWCLRQLESPGSLSEHIPLKPLLLLGGRQMPPILLVPGETDPRVHNLIGLVAALPDARGAQHGMALDRMFPRPPKRRDIQ